MTKSIGIRAGGHFLMLPVAATDSIIWICTGCVRTIGYHKDGRPESVTFRWRECVKIGRDEEPVPNRWSLFWFPPQEIEGLPKIDPGLLPKLELALSKCLEVQVGLDLKGMEVTAFSLGRPSEKCCPREPGRLKFDDEDD